MNVITAKPLTSNGKMSVLIHPISTRFKIPTILTKVGYGVVKELLVVTVILSTQKDTCTNYYFERYEGVHIGDEKYPR